MFPMKTGDGQNQSPKGRLAREELLAQVEEDLKTNVEALEYWENLLSEVRGTNKRVPKFDAMRQAIYLRSLSLTGAIGHSAKMAGVSYMAVHAARETDKEFVEAERLAKQAFSESVVEGEIRRRAIEGVERPVYQKGELAGYETVYSDKMLELLANKWIPEMKNKGEMDVNLRGGVMVVPANAESAEDWEDQYGEDCRHEDTK